MSYYDNYDRENERLQRLERSRHPKVSLRERLSGIMHAQRVRHEIGETVLSHSDLTSSAEQSGTPLIPVQPSPEASDFAVPDTADELLRLIDEARGNEL